jgi:hypothetical protein
MWIKVNARVPKQISKSLFGLRWIEVNWRRFNPLIYKFNFV